MKKFITLILGMAVALTASAAPRTNSTIPPETLDGQTFAFQYFFSDGDARDIVMFSYEGKEGLSGYDLYTMTGLFENRFSGDFELKPLKILYSPKEGTLILPAGQTVMEIKSATGEISAGTTYQNYTSSRENPDKFYSQPAYFYFSDGAFHINESTYEIKKEDGSMEPFTIYDMCLAENLGDGNFSYAWGCSNFSIIPVNSEFFCSVGSHAGFSNMHVPADVYIENGKLHVCNWGDLSLDEEFIADLDTETQTVTFTNQTYTDNGITYRLTIACNDGIGATPLYQGRDAVLSGTYIIENGKTLISFPTWNLFSDEGQHKFYAISNTRLEIGFPIEENSIGSVSADNADAPVEYFSLQGVRVANPAPGTIVIRRQGNDVSKILVK